MPVMAQAGIYKITVTRPSGVRFYIGQASDLVARQRKHFSMLRRGTHRNKKLQAAFDTHGENAFSIETILICAGHPDTMRMYEQAVLDFYVATVGLNGVYNVHRNCVSSRLGIPVSEDTRLKMRAAAIGRKPSQACIEAAGRRNTGRKLTPEQIAARTIKQTGLKRSAETRAKLSSALTGKVASPETRAKISTSRKAVGATPAVLAHIARLAALNAGSTRSDATKAAISAKNKANHAIRRAARSEEI